MKIKNFFLAGLTMLALSACSDDQKDQIDTRKGLEGYLSLTISAPQTKTTGTPTEAGTTEENQIHTVTVVFTDNTGQILHIKNPAVTAFTTEKFVVELGTYNVYALVNSPLTGLAIGGNIERVIEVFQAEHATQGFREGKFFMVNERNSSTAAAGVPVTISVANIESNPATATVKVDRVAVKISDDNAYTTPIAVSTGFPSTVNQLKVVGYALLNMNKKFNLVQTWGDSNPNGVALASGAEVLTTPLFPGGSALVKDQYHKNISEYTTITKNMSGDVESITDLTKGVANIYKLGSIYTSENRPTVLFYGTDKLTAGRGETTGVIYKVQAQNSGTPVNTFYLYRNAYYSTLGEIQVLPEFSTVTLASLSVPQLRARGIQVYEDGVIYYTYFILDPNVAHQYGTAAQNYYGVFRNSIYSLTVNSISEIGDDVPGGGIVDPNEPGDPGNPPIDADEAYIQVTVTVNPWILNTIDIDF